jgi:hypothetical protein
VFFEKWGQKLMSFFMGGRWNFTRRHHAWFGPGEKNLTWNLKIDPWKWLFHDRIKKYLDENSGDVFVIDKLNTSSLMI